MSDGSELLLTVQDGGQTKLVRTIWSEVENDFILSFETSGSCNEPFWIEETVQYEGQSNIVPLQIALSSCTIESDVFDTDVILTFGDYAGALKTHCDTAEINDAWGVLFANITPVAI